MKLEDLQVLERIAWKKQAKISTLAIDPSALTIDDINATIITPSILMIAGEDADPPVM